MHELSIAQAILDTVEARSDGRRVDRVDVRIGYLRQVVPDALTFAWEVLTQDGPFAGSTLVVDHVPAVVRCRSCTAETTLTWPVMACASCEGHDVELLQGEELQLASFEVV